MWWICASYTNGIREQTQFSPLFIRLWRGPKSSCRSMHPNIVQLISLSFFLSIKVDLGGLVCALDAIIPLEEKEEEKFFFYSRGRRVAASLWTDVRHAVTQRTRGSLRRRGVTEPAAAALGSSPEGNGSILCPWRSPSSPLFPSLAAVCSCLRVCLTLAFSWSLSRYCLFAIKMRDDSSFLFMQHRMDPAGSANLYLVLWTRVVKPIMW